MNPVRELPPSITTYIYNKKKNFHQRQILDYSNDFIIWISCSMTLRPMSYERGVTLVFLGDISKAQIFIEAVTWTMTLKPTMQNTDGFIGYHQ